MLSRCKADGEISKSRIITVEETRGPTLGTVDEETVSGMTSPDFSYNEV
jgi:hypothetical protein